jgi:hypothetical protein
MKIKDLPIKKQVEVYKKISRLLFITSIILTFYIIGTVFNFIAVTRNGGRMPVLFYDWEFEDETHFTYQDKSEVNIIPIYIGKASIGDFIIFGSIAGMLINNIFYLKWWIHFKKSKSKKVK